MLGQLSVPIYQGGAEYAAIRQAKETLGQKQLDLDTARDQAGRPWCRPGASSRPPRRNIEATQARCKAAEIALNGVREEARVGQRTTLDVLNAQQELVNARVALVTAQRDRRGGVLHAAGRGRPAVAAGAGPRSAGLRSAACTTIRSATAGSACARPTAAELAGAPTAVRRCRVHKLVRFLRCHCHTVPLWRIKGVHGDLLRGCGVCAGTCFATR